MSVYQFPSVKGWTARAYSAQSPVRINGAASLTGGSSEIPQGPYIVWWQWADIHINPAYKQWQESHEPGAHRPSEYLPQSQMIVRYADAEDAEGRILWQSDERNAKADAERMWDVLKEGYPVWRVSNLGGKRQGAGRPSMGESRYIGIDIPADVVARLDAAVAQACTDGEKITRNGIIRQLIAKGLDE